MFEYTKSELAEKANELNFVRDTLEKVLRLTEILNYLGHLGQGTALCLASLD